MGVPLTLVSINSLGTSTGTLFPAGTYPEASICHVHFTLMMSVSINLIVACKLGRV